MNRFLTIILAAALTAAAFTGCIEPLTLTPDIEGEITAIEVEGQRTTASITPATRTVSLLVNENVDLTAVKITRLELTQTASCNVAAGSVVDLSSPLVVTVTTAAKYEWTITATRREPSSLPGGDFEQWYLADAKGAPSDAGRVWNPWPADGVWEATRWWDTGNAGVTTLPGATSNSSPTEPGEGCPDYPSGRAAKLESRFVVLKAAGGNIFFGRFGGMAGLADAKCDMGHQWSRKPRALKGWYKYFPQMIDRTGNSAQLAKLPEDVRSLTAAQWKTRMDEMSITVALWADPDGQDVPFTVNTQLSQFKDLTRDKPGIIAWGQLTSDRTQADWKDFSLDVEYLKPEYLSDATPLPANTRLIVTVTSSRYANYFIAGTTGGGPDGKTGSLMYVDELELVY